jgi:hypothetical protein
MGMYDFPTDDHVLANDGLLLRGQAAVCLIIGSAAGVAVMGMEHISFSWYFKNISWLAHLLDTSLAF